MKTLTVMRHAKSSWDDPGLNDFDRPLNARGRKAARAMGKELKHRGFKFDQVIASPAMRVRETLNDFADGYGQKLEIEFRPEIYESTVDRLLRLVREIPESVTAPLLVGHNPGLQELLVELTHDDSDKHRHRISGKFPTAAVAIVRFPAARWSDIEPDSGEIAELIVPKDLD